MGGRGDGGKQTFENKKFIHDKNVFKNEPDFHSIKFMFSSGL